jgi:hypothetical protein
VRWLYELLQGIRSQGELTSWVINRNILNRFLKKYFSKLRLPVKWIGTEIAEILLIAKEFSMHGVSDLVQG